MYGFADGLGGIGYHFVTKQKKIALESLSIAFGKEKTAPEMEKIARDCFVFMAKSAVELLFLMDRPQLLKKRVEIINKGALNDAEKQGWFSKLYELLRPI